MKYSKRGRFAVSALIFLIFVSLARGQSGPAVPFLGTNSFNAFSQSSGIAIAARAANGSYSIFRFSITPPYSLLSSPGDFLKFLSNGFSVGPQSSAGPKGVGLGSQAAVFGDFTGNGSLGIAFAGVISAGATNSSIVVFQLGSSFAFGGKTSYQIGPFPAGILAADFNGDGKTDLAVPFLGDNTSQNSSGGVAILLSNGAGGFSPKVVYTAGASPIAVSAMDLNGDGILDLAVVDCGPGCGSGTSNGGAWVLFGKGDGTFSAAVNAYTAPGSFGGQPLSVTTADFDGDNRPDLAVGAADGSVILLLNRGNGMFDAKAPVKLEGSVGYLAAGDLNGDGRMDLAAAVSDGTVSALLGGGNGSLQLKSVYAISNNPDSLILTDYNGDGKLDIINAEGDARGFGPSHGSGNIDILQGNGDGTFQGAALYLTAGSAGESVVADFDGDGKPDVAVAVNQTSGGGVTVFRGNGDGTLRAGATYGGTGPTRSVATGDFNRDGKLDIATNSDVYLGNGDGTFQGATSLPVTGSFVRAGDFNRDGNVDLVVIDRSGTLTVLLGSRQGFQAGQSYSVGKDPAGMVVSDFNRDGNPDVAVAIGLFNGESASVAILLGKGDGTFQNPITAFPGQGPYLALSAGDFNADGNPDLAVAYETADISKPPFVGVLLGNGDGTFRAAINAPVENDGNPAALVTADFNGDGKTDIVVAGCCGATEMAYLAGNGDGTFQSAILFLGGPSPGNVMAGDLNGDHKPDLVIVDKSSNTSGAVLPLLNSGGSGPLITPGGIVNGGSFVPNQAVSPGSIVAIFGSNLSSQTVPASNIPLPTTLNNVSVTMNGELMPLYFVSNTQINAQAPWDLSTSAPATVVVTNNGAVSPSANVSASAVSPAVLTDGGGHAIAVNLDGTVAAAPGAIPGLPTHPASRGQAIILYATGLGPVDHSVATGGIPPPGVIVYTTSLPTILLSGTPVPGSGILFSGLTPQFVGVNQLNILIPADAPTGNAVTIQINVGGVTSPANVTLAIQ